jgi:hypothetical protein
LFPFGLKYKGLFVTLRNTTSFCKELQFEYKVIIEILVFERLLVLIVFNVGSV